MQDGLAFDDVFCRWSSYWEAIPDCPGRFCMRKISSDKVPSFDQLVGKADVVVEDAPDGCSRDSVKYIRFGDGSGGIISYKKRDGHLIHTLCNTSGFERKMRALGVWDICSSFRNLFPHHVPPRLAQEMRMSEANKVLVCVVTLDDMMNHGGGGLVDWRSVAPQHCFFLNGEFHTIEESEDWILRSLQLDRSQWCLCQMHPHMSKYFGDSFWTISSPGKTYTVAYGSVALENVHSCVLQEQEVERAKRRVCCLYLERREVIENVEKNRTSENVEDGDVEDTGPTCVMLKHFNGSTIQSLGRLWVQSSCRIFTGQNAAVSEVLRLYDIPERDIQWRYGPSLGFDSGDTQQEQYVSSDLLPDASCVWIASSSSSFSRFDREVGCNDIQSRCIELYQSHFARSILFCLARRPAQQRGPLFGMLPSDVIRMIALRHAVPRTSQWHDPFTCQVFLELQWWFRLVHMSLSLSHLKDMIQFVFGRIERGRNGSTRSLMRDFFATRLSGVTVSRQTFVSYLCNSFLDAKILRDAAILDRDRHTLAMVESSIQHTLNLLFSNANVW